MNCTKTGSSASSSFEFDRELSSMSSDQLLFDASFFHNPSSDMASSDMDLQFLCESFSPNFPDSPVDDIFQAISDDPPNLENLLDESHFLDQNSPVLTSSSPPIHQMENLSLLQTNLTQQQPPFSNSANGFADFSGLHGFEVKTEQCQMGFGSSLHPSLFPLSNTVNENVESHFLDQNSPVLISSSPPIHQMENLSLLQTNLMQQQPPFSNSANGFADFSGLHGFGVKTEQCQMGFGSSLASLFPLSNTVNENVAKLMQRSFSNDSFDAKPAFSSQPLFDNLPKLPTFETPVVNPPENIFFTTLRKSFSTGDLPTKQETQTTRRPFSTPVAIEKPLLMEDTTFRMGRYSYEERQKKIDKYKSKRTHRNYNKTIKYGCRKTLADNRPRIRGRFARNDETVEITRAPCLFRDEDLDHHWNGRVRRGDCEGRVRGGGQFMNSIGPTQFEFRGF